MLGERHRPGLCFPIAVPKSFHAPGEPHDEEGEPVLGHVEGPQHPARSVLVGAERKIAPSELGAASKPVDGSQNVLVGLPEELGHITAIGERLDAMLAVPEGATGMSPAASVILPPWIFFFSACGSEAKLFLAWL